MKLTKASAASLTAFYANPKVTFFETSADVFGKKIDFSADDTGTQLLSHCERLACLNVLSDELSGSPKQCMIPYYKELWTRYLRTLVKDADSYRWTTKLFTDFPSLQYPYFLFESALASPFESKEKLEPILAKALETVKYWLAFHDVSSS